MIGSRTKGALAALGVVAALTCATSSAVAQTDAAQAEAAPTDAAPTDAAPTEAAPTDAAPTEPSSAAPSEQTVAAPELATTASVDAKAASAEASAANGEAPAEEKPEEGWAESKTGAAVGLLGPNAVVHLGLELQLNRWFEVLVLGGYNSAKATGSTGISTAEANIDVITGNARGRFWVLQRHSPILEGGVGFSHYSMNASGHGSLASNSGDGLEYKRSGMSGIGHIGAGYGFRTNSMFRLAVTFGALFHFNRLDPGSASSTGSFTEQDATDLRNTIDQAVDGLFKPRAYLDFTMAFMF